MPRAPTEPPATEPPPRLAWLLLAAAGTALAVYGWWVLWFLTDDAYIGFRYAHNWLAGRGLVWNPPPFQPVEGYTSFAWVALLAGFWGATGVEPPQAANGLSLAFGLLSLLPVGLFLARMPLPGRLAPHRLTLAAVALFGIASNRTFLTWLSSGLETALFNACVLGWLGLALDPRLLAAPGRGLAWSALAALAALTRPGGLLLVAATGAVGLWGGPPAGRLPAGRRVLAGLPLLAVPAHLLWRRATYGAWLPNTYVAKVAGAWPEAGLRYLGSFAIEYGLWLWALLIAAATVRALRPGARAGALLRRHPLPAVALGTLLGHAAYYTLVVGGDHFEYRVYSFWVPIVHASAAFAAAWAFRRPAAVYASLALFTLVSLPIPWIHWDLTRQIEGRAYTKNLFVPVAPYVPAVLQPLARPFDRWQAWLIERKICMRHQEHKDFEVYQRSQNPRRRLGARVPWKERAVMGRLAVGVPGWVFPNVAIIDKRGLNDRVIARVPPRPRREMAHDRRAPPEYVECFSPNVFVREQRFRLHRREVPLSDQRIRDCEERFAAWTPPRPPAR